MYNVYGDLLSGNCYKIKLLMQLLDIEHEWIHVDILANETLTPNFLAMNPNAKVPVINLGNGEYLCESNAILNYLAEDSNFLPADRLQKAKVLQWQFFEQYSHEPYIAVARYINKYLGCPPEKKEEYHAKQEGGHKALSVMEEQFSQTKFLVGGTASIADISLYAYTHVAHEGGFDLNDYPQIKRWFKDIEVLPNYMAMPVSV